MRVLAIDTIGERGSVALVENSKARVSVAFAHGHRVSGAVIQSVRFCLGEVGWKQSEIELLAVDVGPGTFTGVKVGVSIAKSLAHALGKPIVGVGSLQALVYGIKLSEDALLSACLPARKDELYVQQFTTFGAQFAPAATSVEEFSHRLVARPEPVKLLIGHGAHQYLDRFQADTHGRRPIVLARKFPSATAVGEIGARLAGEGKAVRAFELVPDYIKSPSISVPKRPYLP